MQEPQEGPVSNLYMCFVFFFLNRNRTLHSLQVTKTCHSDQVKQEHEKVISTRPVSDSNSRSCVLGWEEEGGGVGGVGPPIPGWTLYFTPYPPPTPKYARTEECEQYFYVSKKKNRPWPV